MDLFRVRLNCVDFYQADPTELDPPLWQDAATKVAPQVPVIRVFGATETGQKVCAHIRGAFPYLYLEYHGSLAPHDVESYIQTLRLSIDHALAVSYRKNNYDGRAVYVAYISLVKGVPFFGYQVGYKYYLKVYMLNPLHMTRLSDLLHQGAIMKTPFQPHEGHLQYLLQWMCDYNLYGCAYIDTDKPYFRQPIPQYLDLNSVVHKWHDRTIPQHAILDADNFPRQSHCTIEVDICVQDIINRQGVAVRPLHHDFVERLLHHGPEDKFVNSMAGLWKDETKRRKLRLGLTDPNSSPFPPEVLVSMSADARNTDKGGWIHEEEYRTLISQLVESERQRDSKPNLGFDDFVKPREEPTPVQTTLESVTELFLDARKKQVSDKTAQPTQAPLATQAIVDESSILSLYQDGASGLDEDGIHDVPPDANPAAQHSTSGPSDMPSIEGQDASKATETLLSDLERLAGADMDARQRTTGTERQYDPRYKRRSSNDRQNVDKRRRSLSPSEKDSGMHQRAARVKDYGQVEELPIADDENLATENSPDSSQPIPDRSQGVLSFPVVKDPTDPATIAQLSQKHPVSQSSSDVKPAKSLLTPRSSVPKTPQDIPLDGTAMLSIKTVRALQESYDRCATRALVYNACPPTKADARESLQDAGIPAVIYQDAFYSEEQDVPERSREYAGTEFKLESTSLPYLPQFDPTAQSTASRGQRLPIVVDKAGEEFEQQKRRWNCGLRHWETSERPPSRSEVDTWLLTHKSHRTTVEDDVQAPSSQVKRKNFAAHELSQIEGPTQRNRHGFKYSQRQQSTGVRHETQYMSIMSLELHVDSRADLAPDPEHDPISAIFWCLQTDDDEVISCGAEDGIRTGVLVLENEKRDLSARIRKQLGITVESESDELDLINSMVDIVRSYDPDILTGYEVHNSSWGYLIERARLKYEYNLPDELSRMKSQSHGRFGKDSDRWGFNNTSTIRVTGRHMINIWRAMRSELNLLQYTIENVVFHLLHRRVPHYQFADLTRWYDSSRPRDLAKVLDYFLTRVHLDLEILDVNELIPRTSEQARLLGVDFFSVFSRGSQFKVESLMFRIAKPESFVLVSPSRKQVGAQNALECLPLVMEPQSAFYNSPLLVLDFQSLYPSVMIAYNYCYSTCLGRVVSWRGTNKMGFTDFRRQPRLLELVKDSLNIAPNGLMFVKPEMRKSLLAKMLGEILETRVMVKSGMKVDKDDRSLQQLLNNRQLALKLIANVTYGYTSASFSGRMPCSEIADSIVQTGRETLEKAIALIHSVSRWGAEVVYGDTDSLFVYLKGKTRGQAFDIGNEIAKVITDMNPRPVKLKFEKVYHPCVLLAKKRYVGYKYEHVDQKVPDFDAKGIETVRRDGTPAEQKIEEKALKMLFETADLSKIKAYFQAQCTKIMSGKFSVQDFSFAKEVKLGTYADRGPPPPGALIATKRMLRDPRMEPQYGERVPYVVIAGAPGARLFERCVEPERLLFDEHAELDAEYYISKNLIPPLERIFNLVGANVKQWYDEMPKVQRIRTIGGGPAKTAPMEGKGRKTMESYMATSICQVCRTKLPPLAALGPASEPPLPLCTSCASDAPKTILALRAKMQKAETKISELERVCRSCANLSFDDAVKCDSRDCPVFYSRVKARTKADSTLSILRPIVDTFEERVSADW